MTCGMKVANAFFDSRLTGPANPIAATTSPASLRSGAAPCADTGRLMKEAHDQRQDVGGSSVMTSESGPRPRGRTVDPLPPRTRMFHIGPAKTGTTSLQAAAAAVRTELLENGRLVAIGHVSARRQPGTSCRGRTRGLR